jgi:hypothetical protein
MPALQPIAIPERLRVVATLARLMQTLDHSATPVGPAQYRSVAQHLAQALAEAEADSALEAVLNTYPAAAELYENVRYEHAGLCRLPLARSLQSEQAAREAIHTARKP